MLLLADTNEKAALRGSGNHVAVQHEAEPAKHPDLPQLTLSRENRAHTPGEIFINIMKPLPR
jgi:hypothetical protein